MLQILNSDGIIVNKEAFNALDLRAQDYLEIYRLMVLTRLFEERATIEARLGRIPLYISPRGQEAAEVASAYALGKGDWIFWYSRSQGAAFTRGISLETMWKLFYGVPSPEAIKDLKDHCSMVPYVLVGSNKPHASGFAFGRKILGKLCVSMAYFGEGATSEGDFHGALNWAGVFELPVVFICENNQYAISTFPQEQTKTKTFAEKARAYGILGQVVDGNDPLAVYIASKEAVLKARAENMATLIEAVTYRLAPHTTAVGEIIKPSEEERKKAEANEPLLRFKKFLINSGQELLGLEWNEDKDRALKDEIADNIKKTAQDTYKLLEGVDGKVLISKGVDLHNKPRVGDHYKNIKTIFFGPEVITSATCRDAINFAHFDLETHDSTVVTLGEDVGRIGSVFRTVALPQDFVKEHLPQYAHQILQELLPLQAVFGPKRALNTPLDENGIAGHAIGMALAGLRPIIEIQFSGFAFEAANQIIGEMGRIIHKSAGQFNMPVVVRLPCGGGKFIEHHREFEVPYFGNSPGLTIVCPSTVQDFYDLLWAAVASEKPVLFFEDKNLYRSEEIKSDLKRKPPEKPLEEFGIRVAREGNDVTITAYGRLVHRSLKAAEVLEKEGISAEVLDLRILTPLDCETLVASAKKTGRVIAVEEEPFLYSTAGVIAQIVFSQESYYSSQAPFCRVGPPRTHYPTPPFHGFYEPQVEDIVDAVKNLLKL